MSVRIHEIAKQHNVEPKEMLSWLRQQGFVSADTKSVSSTVSKIYYDEISKKFGALVPVDDGSSPETLVSDLHSKPAEEEKPKIKLPAGVFVKSADDVARERKDVVKATAAACTATGVVPLSPSVVPPTPNPIVPVVPRSVPVAASATVSSIIVTEEGGVKTLHAKPPIIVRDFAVVLGLKPFKLISELMEMGIFASMNQAIEELIATKLAGKHGFLFDIKHRSEAHLAAPKKPEVEKKSLEKKAREEDLQNLVPRAPVVVIMGHVDHGKTTLLDAVRKANTVASEAGGITQHIGAYQVEHNGRKITFLDTPGHAAFSKMRKRGANITDIAILVAAADDGFMPQTDEALKHLQDAKVELMVAINKIDVKGANLDRVKQQMQERGIPSEDWGGNVVTVPISAIKGQGVPDLLEMIGLQADLLELKANPKVEASGTVIESEIDGGRGPLATVIIQRGTLRVGDAIVSGPYWAKVRAMFDDQGGNVNEAPPSAPVRVIGWSGAPDSGSKFAVVQNSREAESLAEGEQQRLKKESVVAAAHPKDTSLDVLFANIAAAHEKVLRVVLKSDVCGSLEAVRNVFEGLKSTKVRLDIVASDVGTITKNDVKMASASKAVIIGFNVKKENGVMALAKHHSVSINNFEIIYELADRVRGLMVDLLDPDLKEVKLGAVEVRQVFPVSRGVVAGCLVIEGKISRGVTARVHRGKNSVFEGKVGTLRRFKDDANEVRAGLECGIRLDGFDDYKQGDKIECFEIHKTRALL